MLPPIIGSLCDVCMDCGIKTWLYSCYVPRSRSPSLFSWSIPYLDSSVWWPQTPPLLWLSDLMATCKFIMFNLFFGALNYKCKIGGYRCEEKNCGATNDNITLILCKLIPDFVVSFQNIVSLPVDRMMTIIIEYDAASWGDNGTFIRSRITTESARGGGEEGDTRKEIVQPSSVI